MRPVFSLYRLFDVLRRSQQKRRLTETALTGAHGEDLIWRLLRDRGWNMVARNWRSRSGRLEVDMIGFDGDTLVFVEVKTRWSDDFSAPERQFDDDKIRCLQWAGVEFLRSLYRKEALSVRFDLFTVVLERGDIQHYRDVCPLRPAPGAELAMSAARG
jgi:putative endonuclease